MQRDARDKDRLATRLLFASGATFALQAVRTWDGIVEFLSSLQTVFSPELHLLAPVTLQNHRGREVAGSNGVMQVATDRNWLDGSGTPRLWHDSLASA